METTTRKVSLYNKIHWAHPTRTVRNGAGTPVPHPLCGQRSSRFYPHVIDPSYITEEHPFPVTCAKCLAHADGGEG